MLAKILFTTLCVNYACAENNYFTKNIGQLHITEQQWEIQYTLNLTDHMGASNLLKECITTLNTVCNNSSNSLCSYFQQATTSINAEIISSTSKPKFLRRKKRYNVHIPVILGKSTFPLWKYLTLKKSTIQSIKNDITKNLNMFTQIANNSENNSQNPESLTFFSNVINHIVLSSQRYDDIQKKLNDVFYGNISSKLSEIIDFQEFSDNVDTINNMLAPNLTLPNIKTLSQNKFIKAYTYFKSTDLTISIVLPVIHSKYFDIYELVPLPFEENNKTYILDGLTTTYYMNDSKILLFPNENTKNALCKSQDGLTICNSFLEDYHINTPICLHNLLKNISDVECTYKEIPKQNYFIKLTKGILFAHLIYPIKLVRSCRGDVISTTLTNSGKVYFSTDCELYKYKEKINYGGINISHLNHEPKNVHTEINLFNTADGYKKLSILPFWDKYNINTIECIDKATRIQKSFPLQHGDMDEIKRNSDFIKHILIPTSVGLFIFAIIIVLFKPLIFE